MIMLKNFIKPMTLGKQNYSDLPKGTQIAYNCKVKCFNSSYNIIQSIKEFERRSGAMVLVDIDESKLFYLDSIYIAYKSDSTSFEIMIDLKKSFNYRYMVDALIKDGDLNSYIVPTYERYWSDCIKVLLYRYDPAHAPDVLG